MGMDSFAKWVEDELARRGWTHSEAARRGGISSTAVDRVVKGYSPGLEVCRALARALDLPLETVLRYAGILPMSEDSPPGENELVAYYRALSDDDRLRVLRISHELWSTDQDRKRARGESH